MKMGVYSPSRGVLSALRRSWTQSSYARPAKLRFGEPILSITFDDFPATAATVGARILEAHGARGTYYASAGLVAKDGPCGLHFSAADIARLSGAGHEIGCHSYAHVDAAKRPLLATLKDLAQNRDALAAMGATSARTHAYPYGETSIALKRGLPPRFACARGVLPGLNRGQTDLAQLRACALFGADWTGRVEEMLKRAARRKAWLIGFTHDVSDAPSPWGTRAADLEALLQEAHRLGFTVLPVSTALTRRLS